MTRTTSPARTSSARRSAVASTDPGARTFRPGRRDAIASARRGAEAIVVSGSRPAQTSAMATASAPGEDLRELAQHRCRPVEGEWLVDGPDAPPGFALAHRREGLADGRRVMAVVVIHRDTRCLALSLEAPPDTGECRQVSHDLARGDIQDRRRGGDGKGVRGVVTSCGRESGRDRARKRVEPMEFHGGRCRGRWR